MIDLEEGVADLFLEAQAVVQAKIDRVRIRRLFRRWYWMEQDKSKRRAARAQRARARPPCPHCGAPVTRGEKVPRGRKLPIYCAPKCMRAAKWKRWSEKRRSVG